MFAASTIRLRQLIKAICDDDHLGFFFRTREKQQRIDAKRTTTTYINNKNRWMETICVPMVNGNSLFGIEQKTKPAKTT